MGQVKAKWCSEHYTQEASGAAERWEKWRIPHVHEWGRQERVHGGSHDIVAAKWHQLSH